MTTPKALTVAAAVAVALIAPGAALAWEEPARGSDLRADLMDALRPIAEWTLDAPVEFVVFDLRVSGDVAFASVMAQRPGGTPIDIANTPGVARGEIMTEVMDASTLQALYVRSGRQWVPVHYAQGATDVWFSHPVYCPVWGPVLTEFCDK